MATAVAGSRDVFQRGFDFFPQLLGKAAVVREELIRKSCCLAHVTQPRRVELDICTGVREHEVILSAQDTEKVGGDLLLIQCFIAGLMFLDDMAGNRGSARTAPVHQRRIR